MVSFFIPGLSVGLNHEGSERVAGWGRKAPGVCRVTGNVGLRKEGLELGLRRSKWGFFLLLHKPPQPAVFSCSSLTSHSLGNPGC